MYKQLLLLSILVSANLAADSSEYNSGQGDQSKKTGIVANVKKGARAMVSALWTKRSKKTKAAIILGSANLLTGLICMQKNWHKRFQVWPKNGWDDGWYFKLPTCYQKPFRRNWLFL